MVKTARLERVVVVLAAAVPLLASAADAQFSVDVGVGTSNNIERVADGGKSETIGSVGTQFSALHQSSRLYADLTGDLAWFQYSGSAYDSELVGTVNAATRIGLIEERLTWSLSDSFGQTRRDLFAAPSPLNRENINYAATGPNLRLRLGSELELIAQVRYALVSYEKSPLDTTRKSALVGLQHQLASAATVSLNASRERVEPQGAAAFESYDRDEAYVRYSGKGARTTLSLDAGGSRVDQAGSIDSGALLRLELSRKVGGWSTLTAKLGRVQTDAAGAMQNGGEQNLPTATLDTQSLSQTAAPYVDTFVNLGWQINGRVTSLNLGAGWADENYDGVSAQDRKRSDFSATVTRALGPRLSAKAALQYSRYDYRQVAGDNDSKGADLGLSWRLGRRLSAEISGSYYRYSSEAVVGNATEQRYWLRLRYGDSISGR